MPKLTFDLTTRGVCSFCATRLSLLMNINSKIKQSYFACRVSAISPDAMAVAADEAVKSLTQPFALSTVTWMIYEIFIN